MRRPIHAPRHVFSAAIARRAAMPAAPALLAAAAAAQTPLPVNDLRDLPDFNLGDGVADADPAAGVQTTLRAAIDHACASGGAWTIQLPGGPYLLSDALRGDLDVHVAGWVTSLELAGTSPLFPARIDASGLAAAGAPDRVLRLEPSLPASARVSLRNLVLSEGSRAGSQGGAILHASACTLELVDTEIELCDAAEGGAIHAAGVLEMTGGALQLCQASSLGGALRLSGTASATLRNVVVSGNSAGSAGGAIYTDQGSVLVLEQSTVSFSSASTGGALRIRGAANILDCYLHSNHCQNGSGGALLVQGPGLASLERCTLRFNAAAFGGAINVTALADLNLLDVTVDQNQATSLGGGVSVNGRMLAHNTTISRNQASMGGGVHLFGEMHLWNSTISSNGADTGGGLYSNSLGTTASTLSSSTIALNTAANAGAGVYLDDVFGLPQVQVIGVLLAENRLSPALPQNFAGPVPTVSLGHNLDDDGTCGFGAGDTSGTLAQPLLVQLAPLANYGGLTETHDLSSCSPAIDAGSCSDAAGNPLGLDQRGMPRNPPCDVGSVESSAAGGVPPQLYCLGDGSGAQCPCGNNAPAGQVSGCLHSQGFAAELGWSGSTSVSAANLALHATQMLTSVPALFFQGTLAPGGGSGVPFGDGLLCVGGPIKRLGVKFASGGSATYPGPLDLPIAVKGMVQAGDTRYYQVWFRDQASYCSAQLFNTTNALRVTWCP